MATFAPPLPDLSSLPGASVTQLPAAPEDKVEVVIEFLRRQRTPVFMVVDAARSPKVLRAVQKTRWKFECLYQGRAADEMADVAPYLVEVAVGSAALPNFIHQGWGQGWGIFFTSTADADTLRSHFRRFILVELPDETTGYFRFYDPAVLAALIPCFTETEKCRFLSPLHSVLLESEDGTALIAWRDTVREIPSALVGLFKLRAEHVAALDALAQRAFVARACRMLQSAMPHKIPNLHGRPLASYVTALVRQAEAFSIRTASGLMRFIGLSTALGPTLFKRPTFAAIMSRPDLTPDAKLKRVTQVLFAGIAKFERSSAEGSVRKRGMK